MSKSAVTNVVKSKQPRVSLLDLPEEILYSIFEYLTPDILGRLRATNKLFNALSNNPVLWSKVSKAVNYNQKLKSFSFKEKSVSNEQHIFNIVNGFLTRSNTDNNQFTFWKSNTLNKDNNFVIPPVKYKEDMEYFSDIECINKNYCIVNAEVSTLYPRNIIIFDKEVKSIIAVYGDKCNLSLDNVPYSEHFLLGNNPIIVATRNLEDKYIFFAESDRYANITLFDGKKFESFDQERGNKTDGNSWGELKFKNVELTLPDHELDKKLGTIINLLFTADHKLMTITSNGYLITREIIENQNELGIAQEGYLEQLPVCSVRGTALKIQTALLLKNQHIVCGYEKGVVCIYAKGPAGQYAQIKQIDCNPKEIKNSIYKKHRPSIWSCLQTAPSGDVVAGIIISNELLIIDGNDYSLKTKITYDDAVAKAFVLNTGSIVTLTDSNQIDITSFSYNHNKSNQIDITRFSYNHNKKRSYCSIM